MDWSIKNQIKCWLSIKKMISDVHFVCGPRNQGKIILNRISVEKTEEETLIDILRDTLERFIYGRWEKTSPICVKMLRSLDRNTSFEQKEFLFPMIMWSGTSKHWSRKCWESLGVPYFLKFHKWQNILCSHAENIAQNTFTTNSIRRTEEKWRGLQKITDGRGFGEVSLSVQLQKFLCLAMPINLY